MAPRGGGGGRTTSFGGAFSSQGSGGDDSSSPNVWFQTTHLYGSKFHDAYRVANLVFNGIFMISLFGLKLWAASLRKRRRHNNSSQATKLVLELKQWRIAIVFGVISFAFNFSVDIIYEDDTNVANVFFLVQAIIYAAAYVAEMFLLLTIYTILLQCFVQPHSPDDTKRKQMGTIFKLHIILCIILAALYVAYWVLELRYTVEGVVQNFGDGVFYAVDRKPVINQLLVAYRALYVVASVEVILSTLFLAVNAQKHHLRRAGSICLVGLIGFPFLVYAITCLVDSVRNGLNHHHYAVGTFLAENIIEGTTFILAYVGIIFACKQLAQDISTSLQGDQQYYQGPAMLQYGPTMSPHASQQYGPQHWGFPQYGATPQQYGPPPDWYRSPSQQLGSPPQELCGPPQQFGQGPKPYNLGATEAHEVPANHNI